MTDSLLPELNEPASYLNDLVGEGKKFKDLEALAYGKHQSDVYVKTLERQLDQLKSDYTEARSELQSRAKFEELADRLARPREPVEQRTEPKPEIDYNQIRSLISKELQETEAKKRELENFNMVRDKLSATFGAEHVESKLKEVGLDGPTGAQIAKLNPQLVLKALGVDRAPEPGFQAPPRNAGFNQKPEQKRTWAYYQEMFKTNPKLKYDSKTNVQMQKDYVALGQAFEDGDFHRFG